MMMCHSTFCLVMEEVHSDWNGKISDPDNFFTKTGKLKEQSECESPEVKLSSKEADTPPSVTQSSEENRLV